MKDCAKRFFSSGHSFYRGGRTRHRFIALHQLILPKTTKLTTIGPLTAIIRRETLTPLAKQKRIAGHSRYPQFFVFDFFIHTEHDRRSREAPRAILTDGQKQSDIYNLPKNCNTLTASPLICELLIVLWFFRRSE